MAPAAKSKKSKEVKEKVSHPQSRKAGQLERKHLRTSKLAQASSKRNKHQYSQINKFNFFYNVIPIDKDALTLAELHEVVQDIWLARYDEELEAERAARRKGRPKSVKETKLENLKLVESEEYRNGMEVPDLTHPPTVEMFRKWDLVELPFLQLLRFIRISSQDPESVVISRPGKHLLITGVTPSKEVPNTNKDMVFGSAVTIPLQNSGTMMAMDEST